VDDAFRGLEVIRTIEPEINRSEYVEAYHRWLECLKQLSQE